MPRATNAVARKRRKKKVKVKFAFSSTEAAATFTCTLDKGPAKRCRSPKEYGLKRGKHVFRVAATDAAGNADPSAASFKVRVKPAKRRHHRHHH